MVRLLISFLLALFLPSLAAAEPQSAEGFFEKDFSKSPISKEAEPILPKTDQQKIADQKTNKTDSDNKISESLEPLPTPPSADFDNRKKVKIDSIGLILNALNREQSASKVKELLEIVNQYDFGVGQVTMIGGMPTPEVLAVATAIVARGGEINVLGRVPYRYKVSKSPTWILKCDEGEIVLEGMGSIKANFDKEGLFVYPETAPIGVPAASRSDGVSEGAGPSAEAAVQEALETAKKLPSASETPGE